MLGTKDKETQEMSFIVRGRKLRQAEAILWKVSCFDSGMGDEAGTHVSLS